MRTTIQSFTCVFIVVFAASFFLSLIIVPSPTQDHSSIVSAYPAPLPFPTSTGGSVSSAYKIHLPSLRAQAPAPPFFAGYDYLASSLGVRAILPFANPSVTGAFFQNFLSTEWVMVAAIPTKGYVQAGWIKFSGWSTPQGFFEYNDDPVDTTTNWDRQFYGNIDNNAHEYTVQRTVVGGVNRWCSYIDGIQKDCVNANIPGFSVANRLLYSGETNNMINQLGGTPGARFKMTNLAFRQSSDGNWYQVNTNNLRSITTPGTPYRANKGIDNSTVTFMENWTQ
jgi:hypothetical protein